MELVKQTGYNEIVTDFARATLLCGFDPKAFHCLWTYITEGKNKRATQIAICKLVRSLSS